MRPEEIIEDIKSRIRDVHEQLLKSYMDLITVRDEVEALPTTYPVRTPLSDDKMKAEAIGLELHEMDAIIDGNITITDPRLRDAVYAVVIDTMHTVMEKNGLLPE